MIMAEALIKKRQYENTATNDCLHLKRKRRHGWIRTIVKSFADFNLSSRPRGYVCCCKYACDFNKDKWRLLVYQFYRLF